MPLAIGNSIGMPFSRRSGGGGFDTDYQAVLDYATTEGDTLPSAGVQDAQNQLFVSAKSNGYFSKLKELHVFRDGTTGISDFKSIDLIRLNKATYINSPTITSTGVQGDGVSAAVDLNFDAAIETSSTSLTFGYWSVNGTSAREGQMCGVDAVGAGIQIRPDLGDSRFFVSANSQADAILLIPTPPNEDVELITLTSNGITSTLRKNGTSLGSFSITTAQTVTDSVHLLCRNLGGTLNNFSSDTLSMSFIADEMTLSEINSLKSDFQTYINSI